MNSDTSYADLNKSQSFDLQKDSLDLIYQS